MTTSTPASSRPEGSSRLKVGIIGASGYSGETLVRLLARHPLVELSMLGSRSLAGRPLPEVMPHFRGRFEELRFVNSEISSFVESDLACIFLALPHGVAAEFALPLAEAGKQVIDLSADFRLHSPELYERYYGHPHPAPAWLQRTPYVLPELMPDVSWREARLIACPGCYPTSVQLPLAPLLAADLIEASGIVVNSLSGISGAGKQAKEFYSFAERAESVLAYGAPHHRHVGEIEEQLSRHAGQPVVLQFTPHLIPMRCGIATTIVGRAKASLKDLYEAWETAYPQSCTPFVRILPAGNFPETRYVVGTNRCDLSALHDSRTGHFLLFSVIDNLIKGAAGQAVQIMNLLYNFKLTDGLVD